VAVEEFKENVIPSQPSPASQIACAKGRQQWWKARVRGSMGGRGTRGVDTGGPKAEVHNKGDADGGDAAVADGKVMIPVMDLHMHKSFMRAS
jgi:hypothetical protein